MLIPVTAAAVVVITELREKIIYCIKALHFTAGSSTKHEEAVRKKECIPLSGQNQVQRLLVVVVVVKVLR